MFPFGPPKNSVKTKRGTEKRTFGQADPLVPRGTPGFSEVDLEGYQRAWRLRHAADDGLVLQAPGLL